MKVPRRRGSRAKQATAAASAIQSDESIMIALSGRIAASVTEFRMSSLNLVTTFGKLEDGSAVLVPLLDWQLFGQSALSGSEIGLDETGPEISSHLLSLDNLAFLLQDIAFDLREALSLLGTQASSAVTPVESRMRYTSKMLRLAAGSLTAAAEQIDGNLDGPESPATSLTDRTPAAPPRPPRPRNGSSRRP